MSPDSISPQPTSRVSRATVVAIACVAAGVLVAAVSVAIVVLGTPGASRLARWDVHHALVTPDESTLILATPDQGTHVIDNAGLEPVRVLHPALVGIALSGDGRRLLMGHVPIIEVCDLASSDGGDTRELSLPQDGGPWFGMWTAAPDPGGDGWAIAVNDEPPRIVCIDAKGTTVRGTATLGLDSVWGLGGSNAEGVLVATSLDGGVEILDATTLESLRRVDVGPGELGPSVACGAGRVWVGTDDGSGDIVEIPLAPESEVHRVPTGARGMTTVAYSRPSGELVSVTSRHGGGYDYVWTACAFDAKEGGLRELSRTTREAGSHAVCAAVIGGGRALVGGQCGGSFVWDYRSPAAE